MNVCMHVKNTYYFHSIFGIFFLDMSESASGAQTTSGGNAIICRSELPQYELPKESWKKFVPMVDVPFWPDSGIEWYLTRPRKKYQHRQLKTLYQWPPPELVQNQHVQATGKFLNRTMGSKIIVLLCTFSCTIFLYSYKISYQNTSKFAKIFWE